MANELPKCTLGVGEAAAAAGQDADEASGMGWAIDVVLVGGATVGGSEPFAIGPWLAEVEVSDCGVSPGGEFRVVGEGAGGQAHFLCPSRGQT